MPIDLANYHPDWKNISRQIREQADHKCEFCGAPNHELIARDKQNPEKWHVVTGTGDAESDDGDKIIKVVLTVAHLDHDRSNNDPMNLRALCQRCHLRWDIAHHQRNASNTRRRKLVERGQVELSGVVS